MPRGSCGLGRQTRSIAGNDAPVLHLARDGRTRVFIADGRADGNGGGDFRAGTPRELFCGPYLLRTAPTRNYDVDANDRFHFVRRRTDVAPARWLEVAGGGSAAPHPMRDGASD